MGIVSGAHYLTEFLFCHMSPVVAADMDESGNLVFQKSNGLVMLHFINLMSEQEKDTVKKTVSLLPMTFAALR